MKAILLSLVLAMSAVLPAAAENLVYIGESSETILHVDMDSVEPIRGGYTYRAMIISKRKDVILVAQSEMLCRQRETRGIAYEVYTKNGELFQSSETPNAEFSPIKIETINSTLWEKLCN